MQENNPPKRTCSISIDVDDPSIDLAIEKATRLVELLREAATIIDSLSIGNGQNPNC